jgi:hypothetical protein
MNEAEKINELLHSNPVKQNYTAKSGQILRIELPRIPMTRQTQYIGLKREIHGDVNSFVETTAENAGEGVISPTEIKGKAVHSGTINFTLKAIDRISGEEIADVQPLNITVNIQE